MHNWLAPDPVGLHAQARPEKLALVDLASGRRWTYRGLDRAIEQARAALDALGVAGYDCLMVGDSEEADGGARRIGAAFELVHDLPPEQRPTALGDAVRAHGIDL